MRKDDVEESSEGKEEEREVSWSQESRPRLQGHDDLETRLLVRSQERKSMKRKCSKTWVASVLTTRLCVKYLDIMTM